MNPRTDYEEADVETARAFISLFRKCGDEFQFAIDSRVSDDEEVRAHLSVNNYRVFDDGRSTFSVVAINEKERFDRIASTVRDMGVEVISEESEEKESEHIGEYTVYILDAYAPEGIEAEWNVPHLLVYGSLSPEVEEACYAAFGHEYEFVDVRNHFVVFGEGLEEGSKTTLATAIQRSSEFFDDMQRDYVSYVRTAEFV